MLLRALAPGAGFPRRPGSEAARLRVPLRNREVFGVGRIPFPLPVTASPPVRRELRTPSGASAPSPSWTPGSSRKGKSRGDGERTARSPSGGFTWRRRSRRSEFGVLDHSLPFSSVRAGGERAALPAALRSPTNRETSAGRRDLAALVLFSFLLLNTHRVTESQNNRGWKGPLWVI